MSELGTLLDKDFWGKDLKINIVENDYFFSQMFEIFSALKLSTGFETKYIWLRKIIPKVVL